MQYRASQNDYMPSRFQNILGWHENKEYYHENSFAEYIDFGFKINIPSLFKGEKIYFHFLVATNDIKININQKNYRDEDISTWLAVDRSKRYLDNYFRDVSSKAN